MRQIFFIIFVFAILFALAERPVQAASATLNFNPQTQSVMVGQTISATIVLTSSETKINRILTKINYPANLLTPQSLDTSDSIVDLWYQNNLGTTQGQLILEGGLSGTGEQGTNLVFVRVNFESEAIGTAQVSFTTDSAVYQASDGVNILSTFSSATYTITALTPSPSQSPNPTPSPTITGSITPTRLTPTPSDLPKSGSTASTWLLLAFSLSLGITGFVLLKRT